jgi:hypothetical protein
MTRRKKAKPKARPKGRSKAKEPVSVDGSFLPDVKKKKRKVVTTKSGHFRFDEDGVAT